MVVTSNKKLQQKEKIPDILPPSPIIICFTNNKEYIGRDVDAFYSNFTQKKIDSWNIKC